MGKPQYPYHLGKVMTDYIIKVEKLVKRFGKLAAVDDISFSVVPGEIFGFLGPNGGERLLLSISCVLC